MKASKTVLAALVLAGLALTTGCEKSKSKAAPPEDISGSWSAVMKHDESGEQTSAQFTLTQAEAAVEVTIVFGDPSLFGGWPQWSTHLGAYALSEGSLTALSGQDHLTLVFSGNKAKGSFVSEAHGVFSVTLTKLKAQ